MNEPRQYLTPPEVSEILGVGVSTVKRLVNTRRLPASLTSGKHRRILPADVLRLVHSGNYPCANLALLERCIGGLARVDEADARQLLYEALVQGDVPAARRLISNAYDAGLAIAPLADAIIAPVMTRIGHGWETSALDVYQEHRGSQTCLAALHSLRERLPTHGEDGPVAVGGGPEGDHYNLANLLVELLLLEMGWRVVNVGPNTPMTSFARAIEEHRPRLLWVSCSYLREEEAFVAEYARLRPIAEQRGVRIAVGGNALTESARRRMTFEHHGDTLAHLAAFVQTLTA